MNDASRSDTSKPADVAQIIPRATYRLQLRKEFGFGAAKALLPYLSGLGISHLYLSPIFQARPGSAYGYDVVNHGAINPELGTLDDFKSLATAAREHGLGLVLDIVPNHMAVATNENEWWLDVLENGPAAKHAHYFDIDWTPLRESMRNRLLLPILENRFGTELNGGRIRIEFDASSGSFDVRYREHRVPIDPQTYPLILAEALDPESHEADDHDLASIVEQFRLLPTRCDLAQELIERRYREKEVLKRRLSRLCARSAAIASRIGNVLGELNGNLGDHRSLDALERLLTAQPYRVAYWKVAGDEINYRRFFDVNQLAALRVEKPEVFWATHELVLSLLRDGYIDGLRIDHIDGLHTPAQYLKRLRADAAIASGREPYLVVEKILAAHERLRDDWPVHGTTGYEFGALLSGWLTTDRGLNHLDWTYRQFTRTTPDYVELVYECKKLLMRTSLAAEIAVLGVQLDRIAQAHRDTADFTHFALRDALTDVIAAFPVYRTYIDHCDPESDDVQSISWAVGMARSRASGSDRSIFEFIEAVLLCKASVATDDKRRHEIFEFVRKFQQVTAPVNAKSVEDTAFYRYIRLLAVNEVGGDPRSIGISTAALHRTVVDRARRWPHAMLSTSTHDSKRSEDVRYRLCVLTELPKQWRAFVNKLSRLNRSHRVGWHDANAPSLNDEYLLLQTLVGMWPLDSNFDLGDLMNRWKQYAIKAMREAKICTSWVDPDEGYEAAVLEFMEAFLVKPRRSRFQALAREMAEPLAFFGALNGIAATILKTMLPGVPDFYQGSEFCNLTLVDPDNRRSVDFESRAQLAELVHAAAPLELATRMSRALETRNYDELKFLSTFKLLQFRAAHVDLFAEGEYEPLEVEGKFAQHVCAFARRTSTECAVVVVTRWHATLTNGALVVPLGETIWHDTAVRLPDRIREFALRDALTGRSVTGVDALLKLATACAFVPASILFGSNDRKRGTV